MFRRRSARKAASRNLRFARFRLTALPTFLPATIPTLGTVEGPSAVKTVTPRDRIRWPRRYTRSKSDRLRRDTNVWLRREALPAFRSAPSDYFTARSGTHPRAKTMLAFPTPILRLVRSFHCIRSTAEDYGGGGGMSKLLIGPSRAKSAPNRECFSRGAKTRLSAMVLFARRRTYPKPWKHAVFRRFSI